MLLAHGELKSLLPLGERTLGQAKWMENRSIFWQEQGLTGRFTGRMELELLSVVRSWDSGLWVVRIGHAEKPLEPRRRQRIHVDG